MLIPSHAKKTELCKNQTPFNSAPHSPSGLCFCRTHGKSWPSRIFARQTLLDVDNWRGIFEPEAQSFSKPNQLKTKKYSRKYSSLPTSSAVFFVPTQRLLVVFIWYIAISHSLQELAASPHHSTAETISSSGWFPTTWSIKSRFPLGLHGGEKQTNNSVSCDSDRNTHYQFTKTSHPE